MRAIWWVQDYLWAALLWVAGIGAPATPERYATAPDGADGRPVVVVPGVYEDWRFLRPLIVGLHRAGHAVHVIPALGRNRAPIATGAHALLRLVAERDLRDVVVVGHSKGGLVGKLALMADDGHRIGSLVAVCTPFHGSRRSHLLPLRSLRPLVPGHPTLATLGRPGAVNARITSIASRFDEHVPEGSELEGARNVRLRLTGHFRPVGHPVGIAAVVAAVDHPAG
ncbi:esterase/lipase family protein [Propionicimonas sp.]|uniref:esterase/lipase family protein n=1 Tax=Propionicimonas sp. TaxID=1955623 RepID=UPI0039E4FFBF